MARVVEQLLVSTRPWVQPQYHQQPRKKKKWIQKRKAYVPYQSEL
jgi:hypothetical protein